MTKTYGYVSENKSKAENYKSDDTLKYWQEDHYYTLVYENRQKNTLKIGSDEEFSYRITDKERQKYHFPVNETEKNHIVLIIKFIQNLEPGSTVLFPEILTFSSNIKACIYIYRQCLERGIDVRFNKTPHLNSSIFSILLTEQRDNTLELITDQIAVTVTNLTDTVKNLDDVRKLSNEEKKDLIMN